MSLSDRIVQTSDATAPRAAQDGHRLVCPSCDGHSISRSQTRGPWEQFLKRVVRRRAYRCLGCHHRFLASRRFETPTGQR